LGVAVNINTLLGKRTDIDQLNVVELALNIDGVPLFHSSNNSLWPVLCYITNIKPHKVLVIAGFGGKSKPTNLDLLDDAIQELRTLQEKGVQVNGRLLACILKFCDCPARTMVKSSKLFLGIMAVISVANEGYTSVE
jgi:hypothetical protein